jgi:hypothetical protein
VFRISAFLATAIVVAGAFASNAEARGGSFLASPFFRNQGRQPSPSYDDTYERREREDAYARARARRQEAAREAAAAQAAAARRARLLAQQKKDGAKSVADKNLTPVPQTAATTETTPTAKKEDRLPTTQTATTTAATETAGSPDTAAQPASHTCRKYSAAAAGLVDTPCD